MRWHFSHLKILSMLQLLPFIAFICICFIIHRYSKNEGKIEGKKELAGKIREKINELFIEPLEQRFRSDFYDESENSYVLDDELIKSCLGLAKQIYEIKKIFPDDSQFKNTFKYTLKDYICSCMDLNYSKSLMYSNLDPYFGSPTGYVDAFIMIMEENQGSCPDVVWLNEKTGSIAIDPIEGETYRKIILFEEKIENPCNP